MSRESFNTPTDSELFVLFHTRKDLFDPGEMHNNH